MEKIGVIEKIDKLLNSKLKYEELFNLKLEYITCTVKYNGEVVDTVKFDGELFETLKKVVKFYIDATYNTDKDYWTYVKVDVKVKTSYTVNESFLEERHIQKEFKESSDSYFEEYNNDMVWKMIRFMGKELFKLEIFPHTGLDATPCIHFTKKKQIDYNLIITTQEPV